MRGAPDTPAAPGGQPLPGIDWHQPWLTPWVPGGAALEASVRAGQAVHAALQQQPAVSPIRFVPAEALPAGEAYEAFIRRTGSVPTRDNLHDFFNGLVWQVFPQTKARLNALQAGAIAASGVGAVRGPLRDALTLFDENGAVLMAPDPLWAALLARDWARLFLELRPLWGQARLVLFGHALLEKLVAPRANIVAHVYRVPVPTGADALPALDAWLAEQLQPEPWQAKPFTPLPVLGVPGWWPANTDPAFYADVQVFRPPRPPGAPRGAQFPSSLG